MADVFETKKRIFAVEILQAIKRSMTYSKLHKLTKLPPSVLSRYIKGHVLPNIDRAEKIVNLFQNLLPSIVKSRIKETNGAYDLTNIHYDIALQKLIAKFAFTRFEMIKIDKILTPASDGIPLAVQMANEFDVPVIMAKRFKETGVKDFLEAQAVFSPVLIKNFYIPSGSIKQKENVLIVDDVIRTGETIKALIKLVEKSRATVVGVFVIVSIKGSIKRIQKIIRGKAEALIDLT